MTIMEETQPLQSLQQNVLAEVLTIFGVQSQKNISKGSLHQFKYNPMAVFEDKRLDAVNDSLSLVCLHQGALVKHHITFFLVTWFHKFQGKMGIVLHPSHFENLGKSS